MIFAKGLQLGVERHRIRMRSGTVHRDIHQISGKRIGCPQTASYIRRSGRQQRRLGTVRAACSEIYDSFSMCCIHHASGFRCNHRLHVENRQKVRFKDLSFNQRGTDLHYRFQRKNGNSFGNGPDVSGKSETRQIIEKAGVYFLKSFQRAEPIQLFLFKSKIQNVVKRLFKSGGDQIGAILRQTPEIQLECGCSGHTVCPVCRGHR